jgi:hypothetical protein
MTKKEVMRRYWLYGAMERLGFTEEETDSLRRISNTLRAWYEKECGNEYGAIERDEKTGIPYFYHARARYLDPKDPRYYTRIPDRESGAKKRLSAIMADHPTLTAYLQTDPRGASLYILTADQLADGTPIDSCYTRGICVY